MARDIDFIKESHLREIEALKQELDNSSEKLTREQNAYQALKDKLFTLEDEKTSLNNEIRRILSEKDEALAAGQKLGEIIYKEAQAKAQAAQGGANAGAQQNAGAANAETKKDDVVEAEVVDGK